LSQDIECAQKHCLSEALNKSDLECLDYQRDMIVHKMFQEVKHPKRPLHYLLPPVKMCNIPLVLQSIYQRTRFYLI